MPTMVMKYFLQTCLILVEKRVTCYQGSQYFGRKLNGCNKIPQNLYGGEQNILVVLKLLYNAQNGNEVLFADVPYFG